jgi:multimeric flavodoxin WrbA
MNITILNGSAELSAFDAYLVELRNLIESNGHSVTQLDLRDLDLRYCTGCFGCWVKTPGECLFADETLEVRRAVIHSDFTLWAAPLRMGFPGALLKRAMDKFLPLIHPYFEVVHGEAHHRKRYARYPRLGLLVGPEPDTDAADLEIVAALFSRTAVNFKTRLEFALTTASPAAELGEAIMDGPLSFTAFERQMEPTSGVRISPPGQLTLFNGSPRGSKGNTPIMLTQFGEGFASLPGCAYDLQHIKRIKDQDEQRQLFAEAQVVWLGFPLYTDAMPALVKTFIEALEPLRGRANNPAIGFLVQSGFPEALHSRYIERYLQKLAARLGSPYLGTIVKGNGEGVRLISDKANGKLFGALQALGAGLAGSGQLDAALLRRVAGIERYPAILGPLFKLFVHTPLASWYWDSQLKENGVYDQRFVRPYSDG